MKFKKILAVVMSISCIISGTAIHYPDEINATGKITATSSSVAGDLSGNKKLDLYDAIEISKYVMGSRTLNTAEKIIADYDENGKVDIYDVIAIAKKLAISSKPKVTTPAKTTVPNKTTTTKVTTTVKKTTTTKKAGLVTVDISKAKYILNTSTKKFHKLTCAQAKKINAKNKAGANDRAAIISAGYSACKVCKP